MNILKALELQILNQAQAEFNKVVSARAAALGLPPIELFEEAVKFTEDTFVRTRNSLRIMNISYQCSFKLNTDILNEDDKTLIQIAQQVKRNMERLAQSIIFDELYTPSVYKGYSQKEVIELLLIGLAEVGRIKKMKELKSLATF